MNGKSLKNRLEGLNVFLLLGGGHFLTLLGSAMSRFAFGVWVYQSTGRVQDFATVMVVGFLPGILLSPLVGVWIDRKGPRRMVLAGDIVGGAAIASVLVALLAGHFSIPHLLIVTAILSCASTMQGPAMPALIPAIVPEDKVAQANGLFNSLTSATEVVGPILAGILVSMGAMPVIVTIDLLTYGAAMLVTLSLWAKLVNPATQADGEAKSSFRQDLVEGQRYLFASRPLLYLILLFTAFNFGGSFLGVLVPPFTLTMGTPRDFGFVNAAFGLGMVVGGLLMAAWKSEARRIPLILLGIFLLGAVMAAGGFSRIPLMLGMATGTIGLLIPVLETLVVTVLQLRTKPSHLGRVFAMLRMLAWIFIPVGQVMAGLLADSQMLANLVNRLPAGLLGTGKHGVYGMLLLIAGLFIVLVSLGFSQVKSLSTLDEKVTAESEVA